MERLSKGFYLGSMIGGMIAGIVLVGIGLAIVQGGADAGLAVLLLGYLPLIYSAVVSFILIYKIWKAIQGPTARTTPGKAVGFLFIPFFNFYWAFMAFWGWAKDYNALVRQRGIPAPRAPEGLALTMCILTIAAIIPVLGYIIALVNFILALVFYNAAINGVNALASAPASGQEFDATEPSAEPSM